MKLFIQWNGILFFFLFSFLFQLNASAQGWSMYIDQIKEEARKEQEKLKDIENNDSSFQHPGSISNSLQQIDHVERSANQNNIDSNNIPSDSSFQSEKVSRPRKSTRQGSNDLKLLDFSGLLGEEDSINVDDSSIQEDQTFEISEIQANLKSSPPSYRNFIEMKNDACLNDIFFINQQQGWAVGDRGTIWITFNGGEQWLLSDSPVNCNLFGIHFFNEQLGIIVGGTVLPGSANGKGVILRTVDGGRSWSEISNASFPILRKIKIIAPNNIWISGDSSELYPSGIFLSQDAGLNWTPVSSNRHEGWKSLVWDSSNHCGVGVSLEGTVQQAKKTVRPVSLPTVGKRRFIDLSQGTVSDPIWMVGENGLVLFSNDIGETWQRPLGVLPVEASDYFDFSAIFSNGSHIWMAGTPGSLVFFSSDSGNSWNIGVTGIKVPLRKIYFIDPMNGWAVGELGNIIATRDGGQTWSIQREGGRRLALLGLFTKSDDIPFEAFVQWAGDEGYLIQTLLLAREEKREKTTDEIPDFLRVREALIETGTSGLLQNGAFILDSDDWNRSIKNILERFDRENDGKGLDKFRETLVRQIRIWRPDVLLIRKEVRNPRRSEESTTKSNNEMKRDLYRIQTDSTFQANSEQSNIAQTNAKAQNDHFQIITKRDVEEIGLEKKELANPTDLASSLNSTNAKNPTKTASLADQVEAGHLANSNEAANLADLIKTTNSAEAISSAKATNLENSVYSAIPLDSVERTNLNNSNETENPIKLDNLAEVGQKSNGLPLPQELSKNAEMNKEAIFRQNNESIQQMDHFQNENIIETNISNRNDFSELSFTDFIENELPLAIRSAADPLSYPEHITQCHLEPWAVSKVYRIETDQEKASYISNDYQNTEKEIINNHSVNQISHNEQKVKIGSNLSKTGTKYDYCINSSYFCSTLGRSIEEIAQNARNYLRSDLTTVAKQTNFNVLLNRTNQNAVPSLSGINSLANVFENSIFSGLNLLPGGEARRPFQRGLLDHRNELLERAATRRQNLGIMEKMTRSAMKDGRSNEMMLSHINRMILGMDSDMAIEYLNNLGKNLYRQGNLTAAEEVFSTLALEFPTDPKSREALIWLVQFYAGKEPTWRTQEKNRIQQSNSRLTQNGLDGNASSRLALDSSKTNSRYRNADQLGKLIRELHPELYMNPEVRFPLAMIQRERGFTNSALQYYMTRGLISKNDLWGIRAQAEYWLLTPHRDQLPPEDRFCPLSMINCQIAPAKPFLDGILEPEIWNSAKGISLSQERMKPDPKIMTDEQKKIEKQKTLWQEENKKLSTEFGTCVSLLYDKDFLYMGIQCRKVLEFSYITDKSPRFREADLTPFDRIEIQLDLDRDYSTAFRFVFDYRGWANESSWNDPNWNPQLFIAQHETDDLWSLEIAIPWEHICERPPTRYEVWALSMRRIIPNVGLECWNVDNSCNGENGFGFLTFGLL
ncbi:MAG: YCF48-related protein [Planctomycetia bacterium]|nr:YCF48-related protein [Planctomycetia bacterium]